MLTDLAGRHAVERELFLRSTIGRALPSTRQLAELMREAFFEAGSLVYAEGAPSDEIFFIVRGTVGLSKLGGLRHDFGPGSVIGILDVEQDRPRARTALALTDVEALVLRSEDRLEMLEDSFEHTRAVIRLTASRLAELGARGGETGDPESGFTPGPDPLLLIERVFTLRDTPALRKASIQALVSLAPAADELRLQAGETLFSVGEAQRVLFVVAAGSIELEAPQAGHAARFGPAALVGDGGAFVGALSQQRARALTDAVVLRFREDDFYDVMEDHFELARSVLAYLAGEHERHLEAVERRALPSGL